MIYLDDMIMIYFCNQLIKDQTKLITKKKQKAKPTEVQELNEGNNKAKSQKQKEKKNNELKKQIRLKTLMTRIRY